MDPRTYPRVPRERASLSGARSPRTSESCSRPVSPPCTASRKSPRSRRRCGRCTKPRAGPRSGGGCTRGAARWPRRLTDRTRPSSRRAPRACSATTLAPCSSCSPAWSSTPFAPTTSRGEMTSPRRSWPCFATLRAPRGQPRTPLRASPYTANRRSSPRRRSSPSWTSSRRGPRMPTSPGTIRSNPPWTRSKRCSTRSRASYLRARRCDAARPRGPCSTSRITFARPRTSSTRRR
mmetsp:Transcript_8708/g.35631  ORF Transcript_8708/g.35631 Transcript_8708/m.35631 type:complete len:235 (+) Transcript_8708:4493-5197(+)